MTFKKLQSEIRKDIFSKESILGLSATAATIAAIGAAVSTVFNFPSGYVLLGLSCIFILLNISFEEVRYKFQIIPLFIMKSVILFWLAYTSSSGVAVIDENTNTLKMSNQDTATETMEEVSSLDGNNEGNMREYAESKLPIDNEPRERKSPWRVEFVK